MLVVRIAKCVLVAGTLIVFGGCQLVGPIAIDAGRDRYNSVLQATSKQQAFENIIRVKNYEPTSFMDVTEIDATQTFTGTLSGTVTGIGSKPGTYGTLGSISPGVSYSEAPLIRYVPLVGQGLVEQLGRSREHRCACVVNRFGLADYATVGFFDVLPDTRFRSDWRRAQSPCRA